MQRLLSAVAGAAAVVLVPVGLAAATAEPSEQDTSWMAAAHQSNLTEIAAGNAALERATTDDVRRLGQTFIDMHTALDADLTAAAEQLGVTLPDAPSPAQQAALDQVAAQQGSAFDTAWIASQIAGHQTTLAATRTEIEQGSNQTVVQLATASEPVVAAHLQELQAVAQAAGAPTAVPTGDGGLLSDGSGSSTWQWWTAGLGAALLAGGIAVGARTLVRR